MVARNTAEINGNLPESNLSNSTPDLAEARRFLEVFYAGKPGEMFFNVFTRPDLRSHFCQSVDEALAVIAKNTHQHIYHSMGIFREIPTEGRGKAEDVAGIMGLWSDIDYRDAAQQKQTLPTHAQVDEMLQGLADRRPSMIVHSGHGYYPYCLFKEALIFETDTERQLILRWKRYWQELYQSKGWAVLPDNVFELARVLRVPGTINLKDPARPVLCTITHHDESLLYQSQRLSRPARSLCASETHPSNTDWRCDA